MPTLVSERLGEPTLKVSAKVEEELLKHFI